VCDALTIGNNREASARLDGDEKGVSSIHTLGGEQEMIIINEPGLYSLILGSRKASNKGFRNFADAPETIAVTHLYEFRASTSASLNSPFTAN